METDLGPQAEFKRNRIIDCATDAFLTYGLDGTNLENIAIAAGVGKATIYRYYSGKDELFADCVLVGSQMASPEATALLSAGMPVRQTLARYAALHMARMLQPAVGAHSRYEFARLALIASQTHPELARNCVARYRTELLEPLEAFMQDRMDKGELAPNDPRFLARHFVQMLFFTNSVMLEPTQVEEFQDIEKLAESKADLFLNGAAHRAG